MTEADVQVILQRAHEKFPDARPRIMMRQTNRQRSFCPRSVVFPRRSVPDDLRTRRKAPIDGSASGSPHLILDAGNI